MTAPAFASQQPSWQAAQCPGCGRDVRPAGAKCWSCVDPDNVVDDAPEPSSIWDATDALGRFFDANPIERPRAVNNRAIRMTRMPDCVLCRRDVNACRCDPDDYASALLAARADEETQHVG